MTASAVLVLAWLALAHLVADFVLQTGAMAADKAASGPRGVRGTVVHALVVAACMLPLVPAFGAPGGLFMAVVAVLHGLVDRLKVLLTRRTEAVALAAAHRVHELPAPAAALGNAWTPVPAALFVLDQVAHAAAIALAWAVLLRSAPVEPGFSSAISSLAAGNEGEFHRVVLTSVVLASLAIVNVRAGALLVATLVRPAPPSDASSPIAASYVAAGSGRVPTVASGAPPAKGAPPISPAAGASGGSTGWTVAIGPFTGRIDPVPAAQPPTLASPERVGEAIGILERLLIVALVLGNAVAAIGLVIAAKTVARFRQLDDRDFAEYYLLGTLCSVLVAVLSAMVGAAALSTG